MQAECSWHITKSAMLGLCCAIRRLLFFNIFPKEIAWYESAICGERRNSQLSYVLFIGDQVLSYNPANHKKFSPHTTKSLLQYCRKMNILSVVSSAFFRDWNQLTHLE